MQRRLPSRPPVLPGFSHVRILGSGGFADVFLYEQNLPRRQVAVKVMLSEVVNEHVREMFQAEANLMAQLSSHPGILTVYQAGVSSDGRPYLVMELCSPALSQRYRAQRIPVAEGLRIAIRIGSAIETAHRGGVLHRDIKPSNILMTAYGHPVLSDFGIAATLAESDGREAVGLSIPWSAPEVLADETAGTITSEVWAFAATVYSLLAGRSPFEIPGGENSSTDLISRISRAKPQPLGRPDAPATLARTLTRALSRSPQNRQSSILEVLYELQTVESELGLPQTAIEVAVDEWASTTVADLGERTLVRAGASGAVVARGSRRRRVAAGERDGSAVPVEAELARRTGSATRAGTLPQRTLSLLIVAIAAALIAVAAIAAVAVLRATSTDVPTVTNISAVVTDDVVEFSWADPGIGEAGAYRISPGPAEPEVQQRDARFVVDGEPGQRVCIVVTVTRAGSNGAPSAEKCADIPA
ncbi:MAG: serine/threonine protein kinase [Salinibacterium sp.]|nr:serine/threonine protein kinase [Salinibacterium sp.]